MRIRKSVFAVFEIQPHGKESPASNPEAEKAEVLEISATGA
jgi:hypothetical protein